MEAYKPRRIRIVQEGLANYTGPIGLVEFEQGVSTEEVHWVEAHQIGANIHIEDAELPGYQLSEVAETLRTRELPADDARVLHFGEIELIEGEAKLALERHSREELEEIADQKGLAGVRELARKYGRTGRSIQECINAVLDAQANIGATPEAETESTPAPEAEPV